MTKTTSKEKRKGGKKPTSGQFNARLPKLTHEQIRDVAREHGLTKTQVVIIAVDRLTRDLQAGSAVAAQATKDVKMLKTVARIVPEFDLGQDG